MMGERPTLEELRRKVGDVTERDTRPSFWTAEPNEKCTLPAGTVNHTVSWWDGHAAKMYCGLWIVDRDMCRPMERRDDCQRCEATKARLIEAYGSLPNQDAPAPQDPEAGTGRR